PSPLDADRAPARATAREGTCDRASARIAALGAAARAPGSQMRAPITFVYGNCVFAEGPDDCWAAFTVAASSYAWLSEDGKRGRLLSLIAALEALDADAQLLRVGRRWPVELYAAELEHPARPAGRSPEGDPHGGVRRRYVQE